MNNSQKKGLYSRVNSNDNIGADGAGTLMRITDFAKECGCSVHTLRFYDEVGVLKPAKVVRETGYRLYTKEQVREYRVIRRLQDIGFPIPEIRDVLRMNDIEVAEAISVKIDLLEKRLALARETRDYYVRKDAKKKYF